MSEAIHSTFDVQKFRTAFPILDRKINGCPLIYFDNAASAQKPRNVITAMTSMMEVSYANVHRGLHSLANEATEAYEAAREQARKFLNAKSIDQIVFTSGGTDSINLVAHSIGHSLEAGDEIVLSEMEHHSNIVPWHFLRERKGVVLKWARITDDGAFDFDHFSSLLTSKTKLVSVTHMSNVLGTVTPIADIVRTSHNRNIPVLVDGCQGSVHLRVDVESLGCDFYVCTGHKLYGPTGIGLLYLGKDWARRLPPFRGGGEMIEEVHRDGVTYGRSPQKFEAGTPAIIEAAGLHAALTFLMSLDRAGLERHETSLMEYATERLSEFNWIQIFGRSPGKGAIISFTVEGAHAHDIATLVDRSGVALRAGHHCAQPLMERLGVSATARVSFAGYNTIAEIDSFVDALRKARSILT